jgi:prepilin-type N-terminal cleavage/methylation domain-containing protein
MSRLLRRLRRLDATGGFTLIELVVTVAIVGIVVAALAGIVLSYLRTTVETQARLTESHDVQFAAAYWQRDVASIGVRDTTYDAAPSVHSYALKRSVNVTPSCSTGGTPRVTLAWSEYDVADPDHPQTVTVSYVPIPSAGVYRLDRVRCTGAHVDSTVTVARNLTEEPTIDCPHLASCTGTGPDVPTVVTMRLTSTDPDNNDGSTYTATLTGERRQS